MYGGIIDGSDEEMREMIDTNFTGTVWGVRAAVPALLAGGGGDIVIVSSVAGLRGGADEAVYAGTKGAQVIFAGAIDRELRESGIRVTTICPAAVSTEFAFGHGRTEGDDWLDEVLTPEDVAGSIVQTLQQPRRVRTTQVTMWSAAQAS
jgi:3-oxoacyl-[acyl-carrier protein] reductase